MTAETALILLFGMVSGGALGYITAWRFARKLEAHEVVLADWDRHFDPQAPRDTAANLRGFTRESQR